MKRSKVLQIRLTTEELAEIEKRAEEKRMYPSAYARLFLFGMIK